MRPTDVLVEEHEVIKKGLSVLEAFGKLRLAKVSEFDVKDLLDFFAIFADKCHHGKEEEKLFPLAEERDIPRYGGPIGVMLTEHEQGRELRRNMLEYSNNLKENFDKFMDNAKRFIELLRFHIKKENNILFPMVEPVISDNDREKLVEEFEKVEERLGVSVHEKYHRLVEGLAKKYGVE